MIRQERYLGGKQIVRDVVENKWLFREMESDSYLLKSLNIFIGIRKIFQFIIEERILYQILENYSFICL